MLRAMFSRIFKPTIAAPRVNKSRLEVFFAAGAPSAERDELLLKQKVPSAAAFGIGIMILAYAGKRATRLRDAIKNAKSTYTAAPIESRRNIRSEFDQIFVETSALCFWSVMTRYWDDYEGDFWVPDDSPDLDYLETLRDALDFADSIVNATTSKLPGNYLLLSVQSYKNTDSGKDELAWLRFVDCVRFWALPETMPTSDPVARVLAGLSLMMIRDVNPNELDALSRLVYAKAA